MRESTALAIFYAPMCTLHQTTPLPLAFLSFKTQSQRFCFVNKQGDIFLIETRDDEAGIRGHLATHCLHIVQQDIAINVGKHDVKRPFKGPDNGGITQQRPDVLNTLPWHPTLKLPSQECPCHSRNRVPACPTRFRHWPQPSTAAWRRSSE